MAPGYPLTDRVVLITGAARGIGAETARRAASKGARVALVGLEPRELERVAADCGPGAVWFEADVTDTASVEAAVEGTVRELGGIDVVMSNAGIASIGTIRTIDPAAFERVIEVNLLGTWRTVRACLPHVIERRGHVLCVASVAAIIHGPLFGPYAASKAGAEAFADSLRMEVAHLGVSVGVAYYSWIATEMVTAGYDRPAYAKGRDHLRGPFAKTYPPEYAAERTVEGIERRARRVVVPRWIRGMLVARGVMTRVSERNVRSLAPDLVAAAEEDAAAHGAEASRPVGLGGAADDAAVAIESSAQG